MKLIISNTLVTSVSASIATIAVHIQALRENHPYFKAENEKRIKENMKIRNISEEESRKSSNFSFPTESLISFIKPKTAKYGSLTKTDDGIEIDINDNFLIELVELSNSYYTKMLKPVADLLGIVKDHGIIVNQFNERWEKDKVEVTSEVIDDSQVPKSIKDPVVTASEWTIKEAKHAGKSTVLLDNAEDFITTLDLECTNGNGKTLDVYTHTLAHIIESKKSLDATAKHVSIPSSLVNTLREYYNLPLLTNPVEETSSQVEIKEIVLNTNEVKAAQTE